MSHLFLQALNGDTVPRPPVWIMRQAGRYLPDFMKLKAKYDFFTRCQTPELATEITVMPIDQIGTDAAILASASGFQCSLASAVSTTVGRTVLTRMPCFPSSSA